MTDQYFLPYAKQSIDETDQRAIAEVITSEVITRGKKVEEFENGVAAFCGAKHGIAFSNGTAALYAAYHSVDLSSYDRVITTPNSFVATIASPLHTGARVVFVDIDRETGSLDLKQLEAELENSSLHTRGRTFIVPVHFAGMPVDMERVEAMVKDPNVVIIEDAAHAIGSSFDSENKVGCCRWGTMTIFSFHPAKTLTTGEGGMVMCNDDKLADRLRRYRNNGIERGREGVAFPGYYEVHEISNNFNVTEMQAALGCSQLKKLDDFVAKRRQLVKRYRQQLEDVKGVRLFTDEYDDLSAFHLFVVQIDFEQFGTTRKEVMERLKEQGIGTQVHYIPLYHHPAVKGIVGELGNYLGNMEAYYAQALTLPLYADLGESDVDRVCEVVKSVLR